MVFEFLIEALKENGPITKCEPIAKCEPPVGINPKVDESTEHILGIMAKLEDMDKTRAKVIHNMTNEDMIRNSFQQQLRDLRNEHTTKILEDIAEEENLNNIQVILPDELPSFSSTTMTYPSFFNTDSPIVKKKRKPNLKKYSRKRL